MTTDQGIEEAIDRIFAGTDNCGSLMDAVCNRDRLYFRIALAPVLAGLQDDINAFRRQRNEALAALAALREAAGGGDDAESESR